MKTDDDELVGLPLPIHNFARLYVNFDRVVNTRETHECARELLSDMRM